MPDSNPDSNLSHVHDRISDLAAETRERDSQIQIDHQKLQTQMEAQTANVDRVEQACEKNASGISKLTVMHAEMLRENQYTCKAIAEAKDVAVAARDISENERIHSLPLHEDLKIRKDRKEFLTRLILKILMPFVVTGGLAAVGYSVWLKFNGG